MKNALISNNYGIKIINFGTINGPVGWYGLESFKNQDKEEF